MQQSSTQTGETRQLTRLETLLVEKNAAIIGINVNIKTSDGWAPLHWLCRYYKKSKLIDFVTVLIENGVDVNSKTKDGVTPLHLLCQYYLKDNLVQIAQLLINRGAGLNAKSIDGNTPFNLACKFNNSSHLSELLQLFIQNGADMGYKNGYWQEFFTRKLFRMYWFCSLVLWIIIFCYLDNRSLLDRPSKLFKEAMGFIFLDIVIKLILLFLFLFF